MLKSKTRKREVVQARQKEGKIQSAVIDAVTQLTKQLAASEARNDKMVLCFEKVVVV